MSRRTLVELVLALAAAGLADRLLPELSAPGLRATLALAPVPLALFAALGRRAPRGRAGTAELAVGAAWLLLALRHDSIGIPGSAGVVAALYFVLVGWRAARLALALRPELSRRRRDRDLAPFVLLPATVYLALLPWTTTARPPDGDEPYYLLLAHSLAEDGDVDLADEYRDGAWRRFTEREIAPQPGDPVGPGGEVFSRHEPLLPLLLAPAYAAAGVFGARLLMLALTALAAGRLLAAALALPSVTARGAFRAWALFAFAPPLLLYSSQIWVEVPAALAVAMVIEARARLRAARGRARFGDWLRLALPLALLPLLKLRLFLVAAPLALLVVAGLRRSRRLQLALAGGFALVVTGLLVINQLEFGNPLKMHSVEELALDRVPLERILRGGVGLFFDVAFGLLAAAPLWLLAVPAVAGLVVRLEPLCLELAAFAPYLAAVAARREWYGGWSPPFRYALVFLPVLALALARQLSRRSPAPGRALAAALAALSLALALVTFVLPGWSYNLADGGSHLLDAIGGRFPGDLVRFLPSAVRPRFATWAVPLVATGLALGLFATRARRPRRAAAAGVAALFAGWGLWVAAAHRLPTRWVELEDTWVTKRGGMVYPEGAEAVARPIPGGRQVRVAIDWSYIRNSDAPLALAVAIGDRQVARLAGDEGGVWRRSETGPVDFPPGAELRFRVEAPPGSPPTNGFIVDRAELDWR